MDAPESSHRDVSLAHALLRIGLGVNFFMHGFSRLPALAAFVQHTQETMAKPGYRCR